MTFFFIFFILFFKERNCSIVEELKEWTITDSSGKYSSKVNVPSTIIGGLNEAKFWDFDLYYGKNLEKIDDSLFILPWTYETQFVLENVEESEIVLIEFKGLNYKADIWVNDVQIGSKEEIVGAFRHFQFDITTIIQKTGCSKCKVNIKVVIYRANDFSFPWNNNSTDLAITFVDWSHHPPDYSCGLFREVNIYRLSSTPLEHALTFEGISVNTHLENDKTTGNMIASVEVSYVVKNWEKEDLPKDIVFFADLGIENVPILKKELSEGIPSQQETRILFDMIKIKIEDPENMLWWPWQMGKQNMNTLSIGIIPSSSSSSSPVSYKKERYGLREVESKLSKYNFLQFFVNGNQLLIRGAGWAPDLFLQQETEQLENQFKFIRDMNLNTIRLEGKMESDQFWNLADEYGILTIPGWCCCDAWQHWPFWNKKSHLIARESMKTQARRLNIHPSILAFMYSSDELPPPDVEQMYLDVFQEEHWATPTISTGSDLNSTITGPSGVKMAGPYSWVPPYYWLYDTSYTHKLGGAWSFLTEGGPGESPLTYRSWKRTVPTEHLWDDQEGSLSDWWSFHCGNPDGIFGDLRFFTPPLNARYGVGKSAEDYLYKAQAASYEGIRAYYEGYARNRHFNATGMIQWMLNNPWPEHIWHLYDSYMSAGGGYYATKKANEELHVMFSYTDGSVWLMNQVFFPINENIKVTAEIFDVYGTTKWRKSVNIKNLEIDASLKTDIVVPLDGGSFQKDETFFVRLTWEKTNSSIEGSPNDYWLSPTMDVLNWTDQQYWRTGCSQYANFLQLKELKEVDLLVNPKFTNNHRIEVDVTNPSSSGVVAFFIEVILYSSNHPEVDITPVFWNDNWITLKPGETRTLETVLPEDIKEEEVIVKVECYNNICS